MRMRKTVLVVVLQAISAITFGQSPDFKHHLKIISAASNKCLDVRDAASKNGARIQLWECTGVDNQKWHLKTWNNSLYISSKPTQKVLDVVDGLNDNGARIQQWEPTGVLNQLWDLVPVLSPPGQTYYYVKSRKSAKCLDVVGNSKVNGTDIQIWDCTGVENQKWRFDVTSDDVPGSFYIGIGSLFVRDTRSKHEDTVYASLSLWVNEKKVGTAIWDGAGGRDFNNGQHNLNPSARLNTGTVGSEDKVRINLIVVNLGHTPSEDDYKKAAGAVGSQTCKDILSCAATGLGEVLTVWFTANCDGPLAEANFTVTGRQLNSTAPDDPTQWSGLLVPDTDGNTFYGADSPPGCGHNSNYRVDLAVSRR